MFNLLDFNLDEIQPAFLNVPDAARWCMENKKATDVFFVNDDDGEIIAIVHCNMVWTPNERLTPRMQKRKINHG